MLRLPQVTLHQPTELEEALYLLDAEPTTRILAGGTDLVPALKHGLSTPPALLSLGGLGLDRIERTETGWSVGAGVTLRELERWDAPGPLAVAAAAAALVAAPPVRSRATVGGNLCLDTRCVFYNQTAFWRSGRPACFKAGGDVCHVAPGGSTCHACHQSDLAPALIALGASVLIKRVGGERTLLLEELYRADGKAPLTLEPGELVIRIDLPAPAAAAGADYQKIRPRKGLDFPAVAAAVSLQRAADATCATARVVLGAVGSAPVRVAAAEAALVGSALEPAALGLAAEACVAAAKPMKNVDFSPLYRRRVAGVLLEQSALQAWQRASK